jgi:hypothetical protein
MADQDFDINIRTLADTTGIKLTQAQLEALQNAAKEGNIRAITAMKQLTDAQAEAQSKLGIGLTGSALGLGTIVTLVTAAINKWRAFNDEQDRMVDGMIRAEEKARALGEAIIETQDAMISAQRVDTEPLEQSFVRLQQEIIRLKTEQSLLNLPEQGEEWKKLNAEIHVNEALLHRVTSAMQKQADEADKLAKANAKAHEKDVEDREKFERSALAAANPNVQRVLQNEAEARRTGDQMFQKSAEAYERGLGPDQRAELEQLRVLEQIRDAWR